MTSTLQEAIQAIKSGDPFLGKQLLNQVIESDPDHELAWLWMTKCVDHPTQQIYCLEEVLRINPENQTAVRILARLKKKVGMTDAAETGETLQAGSERTRIRMGMLLGVIPILVLILSSLGGWYVFSNQQQGSFSGNELAGTFWGPEEDNTFRLESMFIAEAGEEITVSYDAQIQSGAIAIYLRPMVIFWEEPGAPRGSGTDSIHVRQSGVGQFSFVFEEKSLYGIKIDGLVGQEGKVEATYTIQWTKTSP